MLTIPAPIAPFLVCFRDLFSSRVWQSAQILLIGAILCPGKRTVSAILRVMDLAQEQAYGKYHRVLNRAVWSARQGARRLLIHLVGTFVPSGPIVMGIDDTLERRKGPRIEAKGVYRDAVRSSKSQVVKTQGLRWLSLMLLTTIPWAKRVWALPFFTVLAPSERYDQQQGRRHKTLSDRARQMGKQVRRWLPEREIVIVGDSAFAVLELLDALVKLVHPVYVVTRLRLDAALFEAAPERKPHKMGRPPVKGKRLPKLEARLQDPQQVWQLLRLQNWYGSRVIDLEICSDTAVWYHSGKPPVPIRWVLVRDPNGHLDPQAFLSTDLNVPPAQILLWFRQRWQVEVTFEQVRAHLGVETQRQWSDLAILRTTPVLFGLFSLVTLMAHALQRQVPFELPKAAWYKKSLPTFVDALAMVRRSLWEIQLFPGSLDTPISTKVSPDILQLWTDLMCYAA